jgi:hypothetical protein
MERHSKASVYFIILCVLTFGNPTYLLAAIVTKNREKGLNFGLVLPSSLNKRESNLLSC